MKPINLCGHDGCANRAVFQAILILRGSPLKGASTVRVCELHRPEAIGFILNDENRDRLAKLLVAENFCDAFIAHGMVKHNMAVEFDRIAS